MILKTEFLDLEYQARENDIRKDNYFPIFPTFDFCPGKVKLSESFIKSFRKKSIFLCIEKYKYPVFLKTEKENKFKIIGLLEFYYVLKNEKITISCIIENQGIRKEINSEDFKNSKDFFKEIITTFFSI